MLSFKPVAWLVLAAAALAACSPAAPVPTQPPATPAALTVFAASSLTDAFAELGQSFEASHPGVTVDFNFAASNQLAEQIDQGGPADIFASANKKQMDMVIAGGRILSGTQQTFARNRLVVIFPKDNPAGLAALTDLARPGLKLVLAAAEVPVGQYSLDFLEKAAQKPDYGTGFKADVLANVVSYEENVRAVFSKVALGEADAGIVYTSDISGAGEADVARLDIPDDLNTIALYPIAPIADSAQPELARAFVDLVLSAPGQAVLAQYGFITASQ